MAFLNQAMIGSSTGWMVCLKKNYAKRRLGNEKKRQLVERDGTQQALISSFAFAVVPRHSRSLSVYPRHQLLSLSRNVCLGLGLLVQKGGQGR